MHKKSKHSKHFKKMATSSEDTRSFDGSSSSTGSRSTSGRSDYSTSTASGDERQDKGRFSRTASEKSPTKRSRRASSSSRSSSPPTPPRQRPPQPPAAVPGKEVCPEFMDLGVCSKDPCNLSHPFYEGLHDKLVQTFELTIDEEILIVAMCYYKTLLSYFPDTQPDPYLSKLIDLSFRSQELDKISEVCDLMLSLPSLHSQLLGKFLAKSAEHSLYSTKDLWNIYNFCRKNNVDLDESAAEFLHHIFYKEDLLKLFKIMLHYMKRLQSNSKPIGLNYLPIVLETIYGGNSAGETDPTSTAEVKEAFADLLIRMPEALCLRVEPSFIFQYRRSISSADGGVVWAAYHRLLEFYTSSLHHNLFHHITNLLEAEDWKDLVYIFLLYGVSYKKGKCINFMFEQFYQQPQKFIEFFIQINKLEKLGRIHLQLLSQMGACLILGADDLAVGYRVLSTLQDYRIDPCTLQGPSSPTSAIVSALRFGTTALSICLTLGELPRALRIYKGMENVFGTQETTDEIYVQQLQLLQNLAVKLLIKDELQDSASVMKTFYKALKTGYPNFKEAIEKSDLKGSVGQLLEQVVSRIVVLDSNQEEPPPPPTTVWEKAGELASLSNLPVMPEWARLSRPGIRAAVACLASHGRWGLAQAIFSQHFTPIPPPMKGEEDLDEDPQLVIQPHWTLQEIQVAWRIYLDQMSDRPPEMEDVTIRLADESKPQEEELNSEQAALFPQLAIPGSLEAVLTSHSELPIKFTVNSDSVVISRKSLMILLQHHQKASQPERKTTADAPPPADPPPAKKPRLSPATSPQQNGSPKSEGDGSPSGEVETDFQKMVQFLKSQLLQRQVPEEKSKILSVELAKRFVKVSGSGTLSKARMKDLLLFAQCNIPSPPSAS